MKILAHLNNHSNKSLLISLGPAVATERVRTLLASAGVDKAIQTLIWEAESIQEIPLNEAKQLGPLVDFTISLNGYSAERLA